MGVNFQGTIASGFEPEGLCYSDPEAFLPFCDRDYSNNIILADGCYLSLKQGEEVPQKLQRNSNVLTVGGTGSGKTRHFIKPNIMQMHSNYCITDPKGALLDEVGPLLRANGYEVKVFNTVDFLKSNHYNPLRYLKNETEIIEFANSLVDINQGIASRINDQFWDNCEKILYSALIGFLFDMNEYLDYPQTSPIGDFNNTDVNLREMIKLLDLAQAKDDNDGYISPLDEKMEAMRQLKPRAFSVRQYEKFKSAAGRTLQSIIISCHSRLVNLNSSAVLDLLSTDELDIPHLEDRKTALFIITSDHNRTYNILTNVLINQVLDVLIDDADMLYGGSLPRHTRIMIDEFATIGRLHNIDMKLAIVRSRNISLSIATQSFSQIDDLYGTATRETIVNNCDSFLYLGGGGYQMRHMVEELISPVKDKTLNRVGTDDCIVVLRGVDAFKVKKYNLKSHPNYPYINDGKDCSKITNF